MKIVVDIGHPAHVHYFKNFIWLMQKRRHEFLIIARKRGPVFDLLNAYGFDHNDRGAGSANILGKVLYLPKADFLMYKLAKKFNPDLFMSFSSMYAAQTSKLLGKPHIAFNDTEFSRVIFAIFHNPFTDVICTPSYYNQDLGRKHLRFNGLMELCYLHPKYFKPDPCVLDELGVKKGEKHIIVRFGAFKAFHDIGLRGFSIKNKIAIFNRLSKYARVFISSEGIVPPELGKYKFNLSYEKFHDALYYASLYVGDSGTIATEAACLGVPAIRCDPFARSSRERGNFIGLEEEYKLLLNFNIKDQKKAVDKAVALIQQDGLKAEWEKRRERLLKQKIDVTAFIVWFVENYPESAKIMRENPGYQEKFK